MELSDDTIFFILNSIIILMLMLSVWMYISTEPGRKQPEHIVNISKKYNIVKPRYLLVYLDNYNSSPTIFNLDYWFKKIPKISDSPTLYLKKAVRSIKDKDDKINYLEWLINRLSERAEKNSDRKDYYAKLENMVHKIYDNIDHSDVSTEEKISDIIVDTLLIKDGIPTEKILKKFIEDTAEGIEKRSEIFNDKKTIELYLVALTKNKLASINEIKKIVETKENFPSKDLSAFRGASHNTIAGWEKQFQKVLISHLFKDYAQSFKRSWDFQ